VTHNEEERAEEGGILRWRFERKLGETSKDVDRAVTETASNRFARLQAIVSALPSLLAYFSGDQPWEDGYLDSVFLHWLSEQRRMEADEYSLQIHDLILQLVTDAVDAEAMEGLATAAGELLESWKNAG
jgi:hypothetical protein